AGVHRQLADGLGRLPRSLVQPGYDVEAALLFVEGADWLPADGHVDQLHYIFDADVVTGTEDPVGLNHQLGLRALLFDAHIRGPTDALEHFNRRPGQFEQLVRIGSAELHGQIGGRPVGVLGHAVDDRLGEVEARGWELRAAAAPERGNQLLLSPELLPL